MEYYLKRFVTIPDILSGVKFLSGLPSFLRNPVSHQEARETLRSRLKNRESNFLSLVQKGIYSNSISPYLKMLELAGCEYGDLAQLVKKEGIEGALQSLFHIGVFLSVNEFKGRDAVVRGNSEIKTDPHLLHNPQYKLHIRTHSSGSSGKNVFVPVNLAFVRERSVNHRLIMESRRGSQWHSAIWGVPGNTDIVRILEQSWIEARNIHWFSQVKPNAPGLHPRYRWSVRLMRWAAKLAGVVLPSPEYVSLNDPSPIVHWVRGILDTGEIPHVTTWVSSAIRVCQAASSMGVDISGTQFSVGGEPLTSTRLAMIHESGAAAVLRFMSVECGYIGYGCLNPECPDDLHSVSDFNAVIQTGQEGIKHGFPPDALLVTSLRPTAPYILLNVSLGDQAQMKRRSCGCPLEKLGWPNHLSMVRSYEKLTSCGMTFLDIDIVHVLEKVLPSRFGGTPLDYQLVEEETVEGNPQIHLLVNPALGPVDIEDVLSTFLQAIGAGSGVERVMSLQWKNASLISVRREAPKTTTTGKILHLLKSRK